MNRSERYNYGSQFGPDIDALMDELRSMLLGGRYILTGELEDFERAFALYTETAFARGLNSGTDALLIALMALGIGAGDEVITQANTFHATVAAIHLSGARPVLVDADERTFLIDHTQLPATVTSRTRAIIPVHLYGKPTPMTELLRFAADRNIHVIEDAAQAHGARIHGRRVGSIGVLGCFSFHPSKNLAAAGDAGAVVTRDARLAESINRLRALGQRTQNDHVIVGYNSKLDAIQARILMHKLRYLDEWNTARRGVAHRYRAALSGLPLGFQGESEGEEHVYHLFQVRCRQRDALLDHLRASGVDAVIRYPVPIHLQPAFAKWGWQSGQHPVAEKLAKELICLPIRPDMEPAEVDFVSSCVRAFFDRARRAHAS